MREKIIEIIKSNVRIQFDDCSIPKFLGLESAATEILALLPQWISVEERLPEVGSHILYCTSTGSICTGIYTKKGFMKQGFVVFPVTHWMELPNPPKLK